MNKFEQVYMQIIAEENGWKINDDAADNLNISVDGGKDTGGYKKNSEIDVEQIKQMYQSNDEFKKYEDAAQQEWLSFLQDKIVELKDNAQGNFTSSKDNEDIQTDIKNAEKAARDLEYCMSKEIFNQRGTAQFRSSLSIGEAMQQLLDEQGNTFYTDNPKKFIFEVFRNWLLGREDQPNFILALDEDESSQRAYYANTCLRNMIKRFGR